MGAQPGDVLGTDDGSMVARWVETSSSTGGQRQVVEWSMGRMTRNVLHWHPAMTETFEVLQGRLTVESDGRSRDLGPGDVVVVPPGTRHRFQVDEHARWLQTNAPALQHELLFRLDVERARRSGPDAPIRLWEGVRLFQAMDGFVVGPPVWFQRALLAVVDAVAPLRGRRRQGTDG